MKLYYHTKKHRSLFGLFIFLSAFASAQDATPYVPAAPVNLNNYVRTRVALAPITDAQVFSQSATGVNKVVQTTQYLDGLGRPLQTVVKQGSLVTDAANPTSVQNAKDLVTPGTYDAFGRETRKYLPYAASDAGGTFKTNPFVAQDAFYKGSTSPIAGQNERFYYGKTEYEAAPLNRMLRVYAPGNSWVSAGRGVRTSYLTNTATDGVRLWRVTNSGTVGVFGTYATTTTYAAGTLYKTITHDEEDRQTIEFKDKEGRIILKKVQVVSSVKDDGNGSLHSSWLCTYYIYDDAGQLRAVLQPRGAELLRPSTVNWNVNHAAVAGILNEQFFRYEYDERGRLIVKKVPGAEPVYMVYDYRDRMVMTQDGNLRAQNANKWLYTEYENNLNRPVSTGWVIVAGSFSTHRAAAMTVVNPETDRYPNLGAIAGTNKEELTRTYYDDYSWLALAGNPFSSSMDNSFASAYLLGASTTVFPYPETPVQSTALQGLVTGTKTRVLGSTDDLYSIHFYDDEERLIQTRSQNISKNTAGAKCVDLTSNQYGFSGQLLVSVQQHQKQGTTLSKTTVGTRNTYDELGRLVRVEKKVNETTTWKLLSGLEYDALGQLKLKRLGQQPNGTHRTALNYDYNIRGWLLGINKTYLGNSNTAAAFFGMDLCYDKGSVSGVFAKYSGNIAATHWRTQGDPTLRKYQYSYDCANRLLKADFVQYEGTTWSKTRVNFDFKAGDGIDPATAYDMNGNIRAMQHWRLKLNGSAQIDKTTYSYMANGVSNKLQSVTEDQAVVGAQDSKLGDFLDKNTAGADYAYDANGNLVKDLNKNIITDAGTNGIEYNHLNLPSKIWVRKAAGANKGIIEFTYDAAGNKLKKTVTELGVPVTYNNTAYTTNITTTSLYLGGAVYESKSYSNAALSPLNSEGKLQFIAHEEGRIRYRDPDGSFQWDYFIKDHLGNVRMVITEEQKTDAYAPLTFEDANKAQQNDQWENKSGQSINVNAVRGTGPVNFGGTQTYAMLVGKNQGNGTIGATKLLKVMSGDRIHTRVDYYYPYVASANNAKAAPFTSVVNSLVNSLTNTLAPTSLLKGGEAIISTKLQNNADLSTAVNAAAATNPSNSTQVAPKAYLCVLFFSEQFEFDKDNSKVFPIAYLPAGSSFKSILKLGADALTVRKNGYAYIYFINESDQAVYFDNFMLSHERGPILEETHYYPFGLTMAGISSRALDFGSPENKIKFQEQEFASKEFSDGNGIEIYEFKWRMHDPQVGRFWQIDPLTNDYRYNSPYAFSENRVIDGRELEGLEYVSIHHYKDGTNGIKMHYKSTDKEINQKGGTASGLYNSASYGPAGKGVVHYYYDNNGQVTAERWDQRQTGGNSDMEYHGLYSGSGSITDRNGKYDFSFQPIDMADAIAKRHDIDYYAVQKNDMPGDVAGIAFLEDVRTVKADNDMVQRIKDYNNIFKDVQGVETPYRTSWSGEMQASMDGQGIVIGALATYKQWKIDNGYGNKDTYDTLRDQFRKDHKATAFVIDQIVGR